MEVLVLNAREVEDLIDLRTLLDELAVGFGQLSDGLVNAPARNEITMPGEAYLLGMPGHRNGSDMTVKIVTVFEQNLEGATGLPSHLAVICAFDAETGACRAFIDGTYITAIRTSASAAVAARLLARADARVLTILGAGVQGAHHLRTFPLVRDFEEIRIGSLRLEDAERLAALHPRAHPVDDFEAAVRDSDIVALCSHAGEPIVQPDWIRPGTHVSSVGYKPPSGELPRGLLDRGSLFVETRLAFEPTPVGCAELAGLDPGGATELGEVVAGKRSGRMRRDEITIYKAMGHVIEDMVAADIAVRAARRDGVGQVLRM
jgi:ornithine cyclodeaminase/alanine dehydrogenase-like protein (mu-crystallin family)